MAFWWCFGGVLVVFGGVWELLGFKGVCTGFRGSFWQKKLLRKMFETLRLCRGVSPTKNTMLRHGGYSPSQRVLGKTARGPPSLVDTASRRVKSAGASGCVGKALSLHGKWACRKILTQSGARSWHGECALFSHL